MKASRWQRARRWWHVHIYGLSPAAADDLADGIGLGDRDIERGARNAERGAKAACPGLRTVADLDDLDRRFFAGGPVADAVVRGLSRDLKRSALEIDTLRAVEALEGLAAAWKEKDRDFMASFLWHVAQRIQHHVSHETAQRRLSEQVDMTPGPTRGGDERTRDAAPAT